MLYRDAVINFHIHMDAHALYDLGDSLSRMAELNSRADHGLLSPIQVHIFANRLSDPFLWTYTRIRQEYHITRDEAVHHALVRTACGLFWELGMEGGRDPHLFPSISRNFATPSLNEPSNRIVSPSTKPFDGPAIWPFIDEKLLRCCCQPLD
jgi:hypothetical protein